MKNNLLSKFLLTILGLAFFVLASRTQTVIAEEDYTFDGVERIVAVGDLHGDFEAYVEILREAGLRDEKGNWIGGETHLVQTGDITDRGPDSRKIYDDLFRLAKRAKKAGGRIHLLIGNHEMMNMLGDLRYVHPGEYEAFRARDSERKLRAFFDQLVSSGVFDQEINENERPVEEVYEEWRQTRPPGFVEHRVAWGLGGTYYKRVLALPSLIKINETLFTHAGIGPNYVGFSIEDFNQTVEEAIKRNDQAAFDLLFSETGPLWYRGMAQNGKEEKPNVEAVLENYQAERIVVGHTPTGGVVLPRFDGKVVVNDVGLGSYYGGSRGFLLFEGGLWYGVHWGEKIPLPEPGVENLIAYLEKVADLSPQPKLIRRLIQDLQTPAVEEAVN